MISYLGYVVGLIGFWFVQDGVASIMFYPTEQWRWNHIIRLVRVVMGITLVVIGVVL